MGFLPKEIIRGTNSDGSKFTAETWDFSDWQGVKIGYLIFVLILLAFICPFASALMLLACVSEFEDRPKANNIFGILIGCYFLLDTYNQWWVFHISRAIVGDTMFKYFIILTIASIITHIYLLFEIDNIYDKLSLTLKDITERKGGLLAYIVGLLIVGHIFGFIGSKMFDLKIVNKEKIEKTVN